jgi:ketosteroid isomerase-like protein
MLCRKRLAAASLAVLWLVFATARGYCEDRDQDREKLETLTQTVAKIQKEVQTLRDIEEIKQLQIQYVNCFTFAKWDEITDFFSEDAIFAVFVDRVPLRGKAAIERSFKEEIAKSGKHEGKEANFLLHPIITVDGDKAKGNWLIYFVTSPAQQQFAVVQGIYDAEYVRENGHWKISYLKWTPRLGLGAITPPSNPDNGGATAK